MMKLILTVLMIAGLVAMTTLILWPPVSQTPAINLPSWYMSAFLASFGISFSSVVVIYIYCASEAEEQTKEAK